MDGESSYKGILMDDVGVMDDEVNLDETKIIEPTVGMKFDDVEEMFQLFKTYAKYMGFPVRKRSNKKGDDGNLRSVTFECGRGGKTDRTTGNPLKPQPTTKTGCKVRLTSSLDRDKKWRINTLMLEHNHDLSPSKSYFFRCYRQISEHVKRQLGKDSRNYIEKAGGHENVPFLEKDSRNYIENARILRLGEGDAIAIQNYFLKMQSQNSNFFFSMDLDEKSRLRHVFWADGRSREAYKEFGDVVTFDTTYLTKKYNVPFTPFVGVNHHGQSILLGCGLISSKDTETFVWLFSTWLACMSDCAPKAIITDQDRAMQNAIEIVFPNTRHRWCLWHVMKKFPEKFGSHSQYDFIRKDFHSCVYDTQSLEEFEQSWSKMLDKFEFHENNWLSGLYDERRRWVPCCLKTTFWAGMSTTQRSESMNAFFDGYVNAKTSLKQFVEQYQNAVKAKIEKENIADFKSFSQIVRCATNYDIEKQLQGVYTIKKFKEFQDELTSKMYCEVLDTREGSTCVEYVVQEDVAIENFRKLIRFTVTFVRDACEVNCSCRRFEFRGILCRHALSVLIRNNVTMLPDKYILSRWRRDVLRSHTRVKINYDGSPATPQQLKYDNMCLEFREVADLAADDEDSCSLVMKWIANQKKELYAKKFKWGSTATQTSSFNMGTRVIINSETKSSGVVQDPEVTKSKGRSRKNRIKSPVDINSKKSNKGTSLGGNILDGQSSDPFPLPKKARKSNGNVPSNEDVQATMDPVVGVTPRSPPIYAQHQFLGVTPRPLPIYNYGLRLFDRCGVSPNGAPIVTDKEATLQASILPMSLFSSMDSLNDI